MDEPPTMPGGKDAGPNPMDVCLGAGDVPGDLDKAFATVMGIEVKSVACGGGRARLRGFLGVDESVPKGSRPSRVP